MPKDIQSVTKLKHKLFYRFYCYSKICSYQNFVTFQLVEIWVLGPPVWRRGAWVMVKIHFGQFIISTYSFKLEVIANVQIISYKIDPEVFVYLNISREVYLALQTGINWSSSGYLQNIFNKNWIYQRQPKSITHENRCSYRQNQSKSWKNT